MPVERFSVSRKASHRLFLYTVSQRYEYAVTFKKHSPKVKTNDLAAQWLCEFLIRWSCKQDFKFALTRFLRKSFNCLDHVSFMLQSILQKRNVHYTEQRLSDSVLCICCLNPWVIGPQVCISVKFLSMECHLISLFAFLRFETPNRWFVISSDEPP